MSPSENTTLDAAQIEAALEAGIITPAQAKTMRESLPSDTLNTDSAVFGNEDNMRFVRGFSDVFVGIGLVMLTLGVSALCALMGGGIIFFVAAAGMWIASEYFGRKKRAHLPTLILALSFLLFIRAGASALLPNAVAGISIGAALVTLIAMLVYYFRFHLPFCIALITLSALWLAYGFLQSIAPNFVAGSTGLIMIVGGLITFTVAMIYDMNDIDRRTRFADNAFWLHLAASPLIVHGIAVLTVAKTTRLEHGFLPMSDLGQPDAALTLIAVALLTLVGLAINRRALIASSLGYAVIAIAFLVRGTGLGFSGTATAVLLLTGAGIVLLGIGWHSARRALLKVLPQNGVFGKIFPPETYARNKA